MRMLENREVCVLVPTLQPKFGKFRTNRGYTTLSGNRLNLKGETFAKRQVHMFTISPAECFFVIPFITCALRFSVPTSPNT